MNKHTFVTTSGVFRHWAVSLAIFSLAASIWAESLDPGRSRFLYQGRLTSGGTAADGPHEFTFSLFDKSEGGIQVGATVTNMAVAVNGGLFTTEVDFGARLFDGSEMWLEIAVRTNAPAPFEIMLPRQPLLPVPEAAHAYRADQAGEATQAGTASLAWSVVSNSITTAAIQAGAITSDKLTNNAVTSAKIQAGAVTAGKVATGAIVAANVQSATFSQTFWKADGNDNTSPGQHFLGTTDRAPLELRVNNRGAWRCEPVEGLYNQSVNLVGGWMNNAVASDAVGSVVAGGGYMDRDGYSYSNWIGADLSSIGGGANNKILASSVASVIGGGDNNRIGWNSQQAFIGGGLNNWIDGVAQVAFIGGGAANMIGSNATAATIAGGSANEIRAYAEYSAAGGGQLNVVHTNAVAATIPGGSRNEAGGSYSFAAGRRAKALHTGSFVWADSLDYDQTSATNNEFVVRARGGVRMVTDGKGMTVDGQRVIAGVVQNSDLGGNSINSAVIEDGSIHPVDLNLNSFSNVLWKTTGNAGTVAGTHFLGTTDNKAMEIKVYNSRALRIEPSGDSANLIGGAASNTLGSGAHGAVIAGGGSSSYPNRVNSTYAAIGGGSGNTISSNASAAVITGGYTNTIGPEAYAAVIGGGSYHAIQSNAIAAVISGGGSHTVETNASYATIAGGFLNRIMRDSRFSAIGGGEQNLILSNATHAAIPGGSYNRAAGDYSLAAGRRAQANHNGAFVWADDHDADFASTATNQFLIRADRVGIGTNAPQEKLHVNGRYILIQGQAGEQAYFGANGVNNDLELGSFNAGVTNIGFWNTGNSSYMNLFAKAFNISSDRNAKENFAPVDAGDVLEKVAALPLTVWNYKGETGTRHLGPVAQDFHAAFGLGIGGKHIATVDADGVALAAIQGLNRKLEESVRQKEARIAELEQRLDRIERMLQKTQPAGL